MCKEVIEILVAVISSKFLRPQDARSAQIARRGEIIELELCDLCCAWSLEASATDNVPDRSNRTAPRVLLRLSAPPPPSARARLAMCGLSILQFPNGASPKTGPISSMSRHKAFCTAINSRSARRTRVSAQVPCRSYMSHLGSQRSSEVRRNSLP